MKYDGLKLVGNGQGIGSDFRWHAILFAGDSGVED
jgi:hypothetical protein